MNELNYASLEASKRLVEAGIALETDAEWCKLSNGIMGIYLKEQFKSGIFTVLAPAHSMAEVWRELPDIHNEYGITMMKYLGDTWCKYYDPHGFASTNPTDALIGLLIWVRNGGV